MGRKEAETKMKAQEQPYQEAVGASRKQKENALVKSENGSIELKRKNSQITSEVKASG